MIRPILCLLLLWSGIQGVRSPLNTLRKSLRKRYAKDPEKMKVAENEALERGALLKIRIKSLLLLIVGLIGFCSSPPLISWRPSQLVSASSSTPAVLQAVHQKVGEYVSEKGIPNLVVGIISDGEETVLGFGRRSYFGSEGVNGDTLFEIGSITKTFTGVLLAKAIQEGKLNLDQPVWTLLPDAPELGETKKKVTIRHLATHSSGLPMMPGNFKTIKRMVTYLAGADPHPSYTERELLQEWNRCKLEFDPGAKADYSNFGTSLLGLILARQYGGNYEEVIKQEVCKLLEMTNTTVTLSQSHRQRLASGYTYSKSLGPLLIIRPSPNWTLPNAFAGAGALRSTANDMLRYLKANMGLSQTPLAPVLRRSQEELRHLSGNHYIGMSWLRRAPNESSQAVVWHNGGTGGYHSFLGFTADGKFGVVILAGSPKLVDDLGWDILRRLQSSPEERTLASNNG